MSKNEVQEQVSWILNPIIKISYIQEIFLEMKLDIYPGRKSFSFRSKLSEREKIVFTKEDILILNSIKANVQASILRGELKKYTYFSVFINKYLIPALKNVAEVADYKQTSLNYNTVRTSYDCRTHSPFMKKGAEIAMRNYKKIIL